MKSKIYLFIHTPLDLKLGACGAMKSNKYFKQNRRSLKISTGREALSVIYKACPRI